MIQERFGKRTVLIVCLILAAVFSPAAEAQQNTNLTVTIPIKKDRRPYNYTTENGTGRNCGVQLFAVWDVYKNYTNLTSYRYSLTGIQNPGAARLIDDGQRKYFQVYCYFNGRSGPDRPDVDCSYTIGESLPDWAATLTRTPPRASFTTTFYPSTPGEVKFQATSVDPEDPKGNLLTHAWDFADNSTASGDIQVHRYTKPGRFNVKLTATNPDGLVGNATREVRIASPRAVVSMQLFNKHSLNRIEPDEEFRVRVTVEASADGVGSLTNLVFNGLPLVVPGIFNVVGAPPQTIIGNLQPGQTKDFDWTLRTVGAGDFTLASASVSGRDEAGQSVAGQAASQRGEVTALIVGIEQRPARIRLGVDNNNDGKTNELDLRLELIVGITNVSKQNITDVKAVIVDDPIQIHSLDDRADIWGTRLTATNVPPGDFGTITPGAANAVLQTNVYVASDRIYAEASILLQGKAGDTGVQERGEGIVNVGGGTLVEARFDVEDRPYKSGQLVRVFGSLKNTSRLRSTQGQIVDQGKTVGVVVYPTTLGNGVGGFVVRKDSGEQTPKGPTSFVLAPDETVEITAIAPTLELPTDTWLTLNYEVRAFVFGEGPKARPTTPFEVEVVEKPSEGWSGRHQVQLAKVPPVFEPCPECPTDLSHNRSLSCCFSQGLYNFGGFLIDSAALAAGTAWEYILLQQRLRAWKQWVLLQTIHALGGDEAARQRLASEIENDINALGAAGVQSLQDIQRIGDLILPAMDRALSDTKAVLETGDLNIVSAYLVKAAGENADMALEAIVAARTTYRVLAGVREASQEAATIALRASLEKQKDELPRIVEEFAAKHDGDLSRLPESDELPTSIDVYDMPRVHRDGYGVSTKVVDAIMGVSKKHGVILPFRSRSPLSEAKLFERTHLPKPGGVSAKNVCDLDRKYLGVPAEFEGEVVCVEPPIRTFPGEQGYQEKIDEYLRKVPELQFDKGDNVDDFVKNERALAEERLKFQLEEWPEQLRNFQRYEQGGIDVDFHAEKQGIGQGKFDLGRYLLPNSGAKRAAKVERILFDDLFGNKRVAYRLLMEDAVGSGKFFRITGDIDFLGMFLPNGSLPGLLTRILVYRDLRALGLLEHGESFTFYLKNLRANFLSCCTPKAMGGKGTKMLATTPSGKLLVTQFVDNLSVVEGGLNNAIKVGEDEFAFLAGTMTENFSKERVVFDVTQVIKSEVAPLVQASVIARLVSELNALIDRREGIPVRVGPDGGPQIYETPNQGPQLQSSESPAIGSAQRTRVALSTAQSPSTAGPAAPVSGVAAEMAATLAQLIADGYRAEPPPVRSQGGQWRSVNPEQIRTGPPGSGLRIAPYTYITEDVPRGSTVIPVLGLPDLGITNASPFFAVGDQVVIDPGGSREEFATLVSVQPFTLSRPLEHLQEIGTPLLFLSGINNADGLPAALPASDNLLVWLRADAGLTLTNGANVISWTDQSRNGFVFASRSETARPALVANAGNGSPALRFDPAKRNQLNGNLGTTLSNATIFTLMRLNPQTSTRYIYAFGTRNTSGYMMTLARRGGDDAYHYDGAAEWANPGTWGDTNFVVLSQTYGGSGPDHHRLDLNGKTVIASRTTTGRPYSAVTDDVVIGNYLSATYNFSGDLMEWIVYNRSLNETEKSQVEEYLRQRAGLPPFPAATNASLASVGFGVGSPDRQTASWTYNTTNGVSHAIGGVAPSVNVLDQAFPGEEVHTQLSATGANGAIGMLFGYENRGNFYLLDWRAISKTNNWGEVAPSGLRLIHFHMPPGVEAPSFNDFYASTNSLNTTVLVTNTLTWTPDRIYDVILRSSASGISMELLDGDTQLLAWDLPEWTGPIGWFGHYSHGVESAEYGPVTVTEALLDDPITISISSGAATGQWTLQWTGGPGPFLLEKTADLGSGVWQAVGTADSSSSRTIFAENQKGFFRVRRITSP